MQSAGGLKRTPSGFFLKIIHLIGQPFRTVSLSHSPLEQEKSSEFAQRSWSLKQHLHPKLPIGNPASGSLVVIHWWHFPIYQRIKPRSFGFFEENLAHKESLTLLKKLITKGVQFDSIQEYQELLTRLDSFLSLKISFGCWRLLFSIFRVNVGNCVIFWKSLMCNIDKLLIIVIC